MDEIWWKKIFFFQKSVFNFSAFSPKLWVISFYYDNVKSIDFWHVWEITFSCSRLTLKKKIVFFNNNELWRTHFKNYSIAKHHSLLSFQQLLVIRRFHTITILFVVNSSSFDMKSTHIYTHLFACLLLISIIKNYIWMCIYLISV